MEHFVENNDIEGLKKDIEAERQIVSGASGKFAISGSGTRAEQVRRILDGMNEQEKAAWYKELDEMERRAKAEIDPREQIQAKLNRIKKQVPDITMDDWDTFCQNLNCRCKDLRAMWRLIDEYNHQLRIKAKELAESHVKEMLEHGFKFDRISINDTAFEIHEGKISNPDDDFPF